MSDTVSETAFNVFKSLYILLRIESKPLSKGKLKHKKCEVSYSCLKILKQLG